MTVSDDQAVGWVAMEVMGVRRARSGVPPRLVLAELGGSRTFSLPLPPDQAHLLAHTLRGDATPYALTCALVEELLAWLDARVTAIRLTVDDDGGDVAEIGVEVCLEPRVMRAGMGDAALLSRRLGLPVSVPAALVPAAGAAVHAPASVEDFRRFLDQVSPDEFAG